MEEDDWKDESNVSNLSSRPDIKSSSITQQQLSKFQELQRRRLKLISKPKNNKKFKSKGGNCKSQGVELDAKGCQSEVSDQTLKSSSLRSSSSSYCDDNGKSSVSVQDGVHPALRKKKLHWGLDAKERWERKANM